MIKTYLGDCTDIMKKLADDNILVDAVICDPPYNIDYADWDHDFNLQNALDLAINLLKPSGNLIIFQGYSNVCNTKYYLDSALNFRNWIVWDRIKGRGGVRNLTSTREDILWYSNGDTYTFNKAYSNTLKVTRGKGMGGKNGEQFRSLTNVWYDISPIVPWSKEHTNHPTQKPLQLMKRCVSLWTNEGDVVLDFTMGSGTTGVACKQLGRSFIGIEKDEKWYNLAVSRLSEKSTRKLFTIGKEL